MSAALSLRVSLSISNVGGLEQADHASSLKVACQIISNVGGLEQANFVKKAQFTFAQPVFEPLLGCFAQEFNSKTP